MKVTLSPHLSPDKKEKLSKWWTTWQIKIFVKEDQNEVTLMDYVRKVPYTPVNKTVLKTNASFECIPWASFYLKGETGEVLAIRANARGKKGGSSKGQNT